MYTKELGSYSTKTADSEKTKELGSKKNIKIFPPNYQLFIKAAKKLLYEGAKSVFLSFYQLATLEFLKSEDKELNTSIRYWFRMLFLRKRAWGYRSIWLDWISSPFKSCCRLLGNSTQDGCRCLYAWSFNWNYLCWWSCTPFMWIGSSVPDLYLAKAHSSCTFGRCKSWWCGTEYRWGYMEKNVQLKVWIGISILALWSRWTISTGFPL